MQHAFPRVIFINWKLEVLDGVYKIGNNGERYNGNKGQKKRKDKSWLKNLKKRE